MADLSRRAIFRAVPAIAYGASPFVPSPMDPQAALPILIAIETHRLAWKAFDDAAGQTEGLADAEDRELTAAEQATYDAANDAEETAWADMLAFPCATLADVRAKAAYLLGDCVRMRDLAMQADEAKAFMRSILGGANV